MYPVSADYLTALQNNARADKLRGTVKGVAFTGANVISGSFSVRNQLCPATQIQLGGVYVGELDLTFTSEFASSVSSRGSWRGIELAAEIGIELGDGTFEYVPVQGGTYTIEAAQWTDAGLKVTAYDNMMKFDKMAQITSSSGELYNWLNYLCIQCGVTLGMTQLEIQALPNGTETLVLGTGNPIDTYRDMLSQLAVVACSFATIDREGKLVLKQLPAYTDTPLIIPAKLRYSTTFSDYQSYYTSLAVTNEEDSSIGVYSNGNIGGLTLDIGANPFLQVGIDTTKDRQRQAIIDALENFRAVPFNVSVLPNPAVDLGDLLKFTGGYGSDSLGAVMAFSIKMGVTQVEGYGENPTATEVTSATDKAIAQAKQQKDGGIIYHPYANVSPIVITTTPTKLFEYDFLATEQTSVMLEYNLKMLNEFTDENQTVTLYYYVNGEKVSYEPMDTYSESEEYHIYPGFYWLLNLLGGSETVFEVWAETDNGTAFINAGDIHAMLWGQKLYAQQGGQIPDLSDEYELTPMPNPIPIGLEESEVDLDTDYHPVIVGQRVTESGDVRITENGDVRIVE